MANGSSSMIHINTNCRREDVSRIYPAREQYSRRIKWPNIRMRTIRFSLFAAHVGLWYSPSASLFSSNWTLIDQGRHEPKIHCLLAYSFHHHSSDKQKNSKNQMCRRRGNSSLSEFFIDSKNKNENKITQIAMVSIAVPNCNVDACGCHAQFCGSNQNRTLKWW